MVLSHVDVVPGGDAWTITLPFSPKVIGNRLYGRGSHDMKADLIAKLLRFEAIKRCWFSTTKIRLILVVMKNLIGVICGLFDQVGEPTFGFSPDGAFPVVPGEKGVLTLSIQFKGTTLGEWKLHRFQSGERDNVVPGTAVADVELPDGVDINGLVRMSVISKIH